MQHIKNYAIRDLYLHHMRHTLHDPPHRVMEMAEQAISFLHAWEAENPCVAETSPETPVAGQGEARKYMSGDSLSPEEQIGTLNTEPQLVEAPGQKFIYVQLADMSYAWAKCQWLDNKGLHTLQVKTDTIPPSVIEPDKNSSFSELAERLRFTQQFPGMQMAGPISIPSQSSMVEHDAFGEVPPVCIAEDPEEGIVGGIVRLSQEERLEAEAELNLVPTDKDVPKEPLTTRFKELYMGEKVEAQVCEESTE